MADGRLDSNVSRSMPVSELENGDAIGAVSDHPDAPIDDASQLQINVADGTANNVHDSNPTTPRFIQEQGAWKRWKWIPYPVRRFAITSTKWAEGPREPKAYKIDPVFPAIQHAPLYLLDRYVPTRQQRRWLFGSYITLWVLMFALVMRMGLTATEIPKYGKPVAIGCGNTFWVSGNNCGMDGNDCRPFNDSGFPFKCPANCASYKVLNPRAVGAQEIIYRPLVIGGVNESEGSSGASKPIYRGDSFICGAAVHAGVVSNTGGGCGLVKTVGQHRNYLSSVANGIESVGFDSYFPLSMTFDESIDCSSWDPRWALLAVSVVFSTGLSLFTTSPAVFFFTLFTALFWHVGLASDPPPHSTVPDLISNIIGKYLPSMFTAWVMYDKMGLRRTLGGGLTAQVEKTILWLGGAWIGALDNYTFDFIPIQRLTTHDLKQQPGAVFALIIIVALLAVIAAKQVYLFRQEGRLIKYLRLYALFIGGIVVCLIMPDLKLRIHHYILALLLLPGTSIQTRLSLLYQGLLVGLFVNGIARWGWDPVLQTAFSLRNDAQLDSPLPDITMLGITVAANVSMIKFGWAPPPGKRYDGLSALVNDVERFRTYFDAVDEVKEGASTFVWERRAGLEVNEYFRFAWMEGGGSNDYTKAGIWTAEGEWVTMEAGPSKVKSRGLIPEGGDSGLVLRR